MSRNEGLTQCQFEQITTIKSTSPGNELPWFALSRKKGRLWECVILDPSSKATEVDYAGTVQEAYRWVQDHRQDGEVSFEIMSPGKLPLDLTGDYYQKVIPYREFGLV